MFNLFKKQNSSYYFAVDIGSQYTKFIDLVQLKDETYQIREVAIQPTPEGSFQAGKILSLDKLSKFLVRSVVELGFGKKTNVVAGIAAKGMITKKINIPKMEESLIPEHLPFEAEQYIPYDIAEMDLDYEILRGENSDPETIPILFVAILKKTVAEYVSVFSEAQLECNILDGNMFALANAFEYSYGHHPDKSFMICEVGASSTSLVGVCRGQVVFARSIPVGAAFYTQQIQDSLGVSFKEAEDLKRAASSDTDPKAQEVLTIIEKLHPGFCEELQASYEFYTNFFPDDRVSEMFLTGGGSLTKGLSAALEKTFSIPFTTLNPFQKVPLAPHLKSQEEQLRPYIAVGFGLSLRIVNP
ncbi:MAG: type IV pilus assembly protein PilM [Bdellovibrionales bacterium]|nr:type IV pilus assembly protein PilM [Bdellovibrionales bacterium]